MGTILIRNAQTLTMLGPLEVRPPAQGRRGKTMSELGVIPAADVLIENGVVASVVKAGAANPPNHLARAIDIEIDARGRVLMPGFVDCHTHACWAGSRIDEWERKLAGATYREIMASGGGIMSTVRATRDASQEQLAESLAARLGHMMRHGSTTIEVKSGYGLMAEHELKMLRAIRAAGRSFRGTVAITALLGHAMDPALPADRFVAQTINQTLAEVSAEFPGVMIDAFCEKGAWSLEECVRLFEAARTRGHSFRVHADQFTALGMLEWAAHAGARSVDHLEASVIEERKAFGESETFAVGLPVCGFQLDGRYAALGGLVRQNAKVCIATNYNPGSAPCPSMPFAIALAVRHCGLTPEQAIVAATLNPAILLGHADRGYIAPGARADLVLLRHTNQRAIAYEVGDNPVDTVIVGGQIAREPAEFA